MDLMKTLTALSNAAGVNGQGEAAGLAAERLGRYCAEVSRDALGSVVGWRRCGREGAPVLMLEAHIDEVGFIVTGVDDAGFVRVDACGRADLRALAAAGVTVYASAEGGKPYPGVFCSTPPHLGDGKGGLPGLSDMGIDTGLDPARAKKRFRPGDRVGFVSNARPMGEHLLCGKSLDDRAGVAAVLQTLELLRDEELSCDVAAVFAVQEELGCRGSATAAFGVSPAAAVAVDVSFAWTPDADRNKCGLLGKGPMLGYSPVLDGEMTRRLGALAARDGIPLQDEVMSGDTGTDADSIAGVRAGVRTALLSIPLKYMHTPVELVDIRDVENTARLMAAYARGGVEA